MNIKSIAGENYGQVAVYKNSNIFMSFLTLQNFCFPIGCRFCMVKYIKNVNIHYFIEMTFQLHSKIFPGKWGLFYRPSQGNDFGKP